MNSTIEQPSGLTLFCMNDFSELGIQRVITWILNNWDSSMYGEVALSVHNKSGSLFNFINPEIRIYELDKMQNPLRGMATPFRLFAYYKLLKQIKPTKVIAVNQFESLALCLVKRFYPHFRLIVSEHCHVSSNIYGADSHSGWFGWYYKNFFPKEYLRFADIVHTVSDEAAIDLQVNFDLPKDKIRMIYNPVDTEKITRMSLEELDDPWLEHGNKTVIAVSRLEQQKRIDILLRAWQVVKLSEKSFDNQNAPYRLIICGHGTLRKLLENLAIELGINDSVRFVGFQNNPWKWSRRAALFVSTSEWEGLPCSLIEAQVLARPVLSSDCPSGCKEILLNGDAGFLFTSLNIKQCADQILSALSSNDLCLSKVSVALDNLHRFQIDKIIYQYANL